MQPATNFEIF